jgi:hypothetical protein
MHKATVALAASSLLLAGCQSKPAEYATTLSTQDPKWETPECREIRLAALNFDDKVGQRMAIGLASGLLLGPFGLPIAAAADAEQNEQRRLFAREMHMRCSSLPLPEELHINPRTREPDMSDRPRHLR